MLRKKAKAKVKKSAPKKAPAKRKVNKKSQSKAVPVFSGPAIRHGASAPEVEVLQKKLGLTVDGVFGDQTLGAVIDIQQQHGLPETGQIDLNTWNAVFPS